MRVLAKFLTPSHFGWRPLAIVLLCAAAGLAQAQSTADDDSADPPSRVARLSYISGDLGFLPAGATDWSNASVDRPLTTGDRLSASQGARVKLEFGGGSLRMDGQTDFGLLDLNDQLTQIELTQGTLNLTVRHLDQGQSYEIDTPTVTLVIDQPGTFRVHINNDSGGTQVTAFNGGATVYGENSVQRTINAGRSYRFIDSSLAAVAITDIGGGDPVGWFPLGPGEIYNPWYRCGRSCYTNVNIRNMRGRRGDDHRADIDDHYTRYHNGTPSRGGHYANRDASRGFTAVPGNTFAGGRQVQRNLMRVDPRQLAAAPLVSRDANKLHPIAGAAQPSHNTHARNLPAGGFSREVVARHAPPRVAQDARDPARQSSGRRAANRHGVTQRPRAESTRQP